MTGIVVVQPDVEKMLVAFTLTRLSLLPDPPAGSSWDVRTVVPAGVSPKWFIQVRDVGGAGDGRLVERPLVDFRMWADGTAATEATRSQAARRLLAELRAQYASSRTITRPTPLPDPVDPSKVHTLFTVQLLIKGQQLP